LVFLIIFVSLSQVTSAQLRSEILNRIGPAWFDLTYAACIKYVNDHNIQPVKIENLPSYAEQELSYIFNQDLLAQVKIYFPVPLNSLKTEIGWINKITDLLGGVKPGAQTFYNQIFIEDFTTGLFEDRKMLAHEIVHVAQYLELGYEGFKEQYIRAISEGKTYYQIPLEVEAYLLESQYPNLKYKSEKFKQLLSQLINIEEDVLEFTGYLTGFSAGDLVHISFQTRDGKKISLVYTEPAGSFLVTHRSKLINTKITLNVKYISTQAKLDADFIVDIEEIVSVSSEVGNSDDWWNEIESDYSLKQSILQEVEDYIQSLWR